MYISCLNNNKLIFEYFFEAFLFLLNLYLWSISCFIASQPHDLYFFFFFCNILWLLHFWFHPKINASTKGCEERMQFKISFHCYHFQNKDISHIQDIRFRILERLKGKSSNSSKSCKKAFYRRKSFSEVESFW